MRETNRLLEAMSGLLDQAGLRESAIPGVRLIRADAQTSRRPVLYECGIVFVIQGAKRGYIGEQILDYAQSAYLVTATPLPFEAEVTQASANAPFMALSIRVTPPEILALADHLPAEREISDASGASVVRAVPFDERVQLSVLRLAQALSCSHETALLGASLKKELIFRVLQGPQADVLLQHSQKERPHGRVAEIIRRISEAPDQTFSVEDLAHQAALSPSAFYAHFKRATAMSPIQYQKQVRLHRAHALIHLDGQRVQVAAQQVGYNSPAQFSRDYKRLFGHAPSHAFAP